ncbi:hypothetical protein EK21DRAFT_93726 [Setomelanomma holmii]|uniref:Uncharacterized protein n=1 Tax=Setomelanomma holmii TaxID=210430 RepID=A0A9P4LI71_9PLEO|nr:hypothetical protein EK21DRAFT_93726 [Setomelanomma holmii]
MSLVVPLLTASEPMHQPENITEGRDDCSVLLAIVSDKYNVRDIVVPHVEAQKWVENLWEHDRPYGRDWQRWVRILGGFYHTEERCRKLSIVLDVIAANMSLVEEDWIFEYDNKSYLVSKIDYSYQTTTDLSKLLESRRQDLWVDFHKACTRLQHKQVDESLDFCEIGKLYKFRREILLELPTSITLVAHLAGLRIHWQHIAELDLLLKRCLRYLNASS